MERPCRGSRCQSCSPRSRLLDPVATTLMTLAWSPGYCRSALPVAGLPVPSIALGSSWFGFAAPLSTFPRFRVGPQGLPCARLRTVRKKQLGGVPHDLRLIFRAARNDPERPRRDCSRSRHPPLVGFVRVCPCSDMPRVRPLPATLPPPSANRCQPASAFRPRGFSPPRRFTPHMRSRACCIPVPEGVRRVSTPQPPRALHAVRRRPQRPS